MVTCTTLVQRTKIKFTSHISSCQTACREEWEIYQLTVLTYSQNYQF